MRRPILNISTLRAIELGDANANPPLMQRAGAIATQIALEMLADTSRAMLVVAGPATTAAMAL